MRYTNSMKRYFTLITLAIWTWLTWYLTGVPNLRVTPDSLEQFIISKGGHVFFFGIEAVLVSLALSAQNKYRYVWAIIMTSLFGAATELHQMFVSGRHPDPRDWALDTLSAVLFLVIMKKFLNHKS